MSERAIQWGDRVGIPKGTPILSDMHPDAKPGAVASRDYAVTVNHMTQRQRPDGSWAPTVRWAGSGGYWREAWADDVVLLYKGS